MILETPKRDKDKKIQGLPAAIKNKAEKVNAIKYRNSSFEIRKPPDQSSHTRANDLPKGTSSFEALPQRKPLAVVKRSFATPIKRDSIAEGA